MTNSISQHLKNTLKSHLLTQKNKTKKSFMLNQEKKKQTKHSNSWNSINIT